MALATLEKKDVYSSISDSLLEHHYQELKESAIDDEIIRLNFRSILDAREVDKILNRNTKSRWKHSDLVPGWMVSGIDPLAEEPTLLGCQIKPDSPRIDKNGKKIKYENPSDSATTPLFLKSPNIKWTEVVDDNSIPVILTEGGKKAASGLTHGFATVSIPGVTTCRKLGRLHQDLLLLCRLGRAFYICFDNDILYKKQVYKALIKLATDLAYNGGKVFIVDIPPGAAKGMDDYLAKFGKEAFDKLLESALTFEEFKSVAESNLEDEDKEITSKLAINYHLIRQRWGENLQYNKLSKEVELYGVKLKEEEVRLTIALEYDIDMSSSDAQVIVSNLARKNEYSPVVDYLDEVSGRYSDIDPAFLDELAFKFFGVKEEIYSIYFKNFLISAVARARFPGCQVDHVFMLQSFKQGTGKSTFFRSLFGSDFCSDQLGTDITNRDEKMKVSGYWCLEWAECDQVYKKKDVSTVKNFITNPIDTFRAPYARREESHPRPSVIVGTTNDVAPLRDQTGSRRFWVLPVMVDKIPNHTVRDLRDKIWAASDKLFKAGYEYKLTDEQEELREQSNENFSESDPWQETIENLLIELGQPNFIATQSIVNELGFDAPKDVKGFDLVRIQTILKKMGFHKTNTPKRVNGKLLRGWERENKKSDFSDVDPVTRNTNDGTPTQQALDPVTPPVTPPVTAVTVDVTEGKNTEDNACINNSLLHPVTPPVTDGVTVESVDNSIVPATVTPVTAVAGLESNFGVGDFVLVTSEGIIEQVATCQQHGRYQLTNNLFYYPSRLEMVDPTTNAEFLRDCIASQDWGMLEELASCWCQEFKKAVYACLSPDEKEVIKSLKPLEPKVTKAITLPILEVGKEYFSAINNKRVTVTSIQDDLETCGCTSDGKQMVCDFGDLRALPGSQVLAVDLNEEVEILAGKHKGKKATVSSQLCEHGPLFLKIEGVRATSSSKFKFWGHHLSRV